MAISSLDRDEIDIFLSSIATQNQEHCFHWVTRLLEPLLQYSNSVRNQKKNIGRNGKRGEKT